MGLIKAALGSFGGVMADQWKEFFYCDSMDDETLVIKGQKRLSSQGRSSNTSAEDNVITNGSRIAVNNGQCMIIVEQGKIVDVCSEPGEYVYDTTLAPSLFTGGLSAGIKDVFNQIGKRFTFGGDPGQDQRVYFVNIKKIIGNKYGTPNPVPYNHYDKRSGLNMMVSLRCHGEYSYIIVDPILFYTNICGNVSDRYVRSSIDSQLKSELMTKLQPALNKLSEMDIPYFNTSYMAGFLADKYDVTAEEAVPRADERVQSSAENALASSVTGYDSVDLKSCSINKSNDSVRYAMAPVWILSTKYQGKPYTFVVNGQTGKFAGSLPVDETKAKLYMAAATFVTLPVTYYICKFIVNLFCS